MTQAELIAAYARGWNDAMRGRAPTTNDLTYLRGYYDAR